MSAQVRQAERHALDGLAGDRGLDEARAVVGDRGGGTISAFILQARLRTVTRVCDGLAERFRLRIGPARPSGLGSRGSIPAFRPKEAQRGERRR